ncbi:MAG: hypothetical protein QM756_17000 [Polyangiaceae bacterium]
MLARWAAVATLGIGLLGCARVRAVAFQGRSAEPRVAAEHVLETTAMPRGATWLGRVVARCQSRDLSRDFADRPLFDVDCSEARLRSLLREGAAEAGGDVLSEVVCSSGSARECRALVSRLGPGSRALAEGTRIAPELRESVSNVRVAFRAGGAHVPRTERNPASVSEQPLASPAFDELGCLRARCEACAEVDARDALRVAAARLGAAAVVAPHCISEAGSSECEAKLAVEEAPRATQQ